MKITLYVVTFALLLAVTPLRADDLTGSDRQTASDKALSAPHATAADLMAANRNYTRIAEDKKKNDGETCTGNSQCSSDCCCHPGGYGECMSDQACKEVKGGGGCH
ncbi:MAG: hypothetical protein ABSE22_23340 [Xanthobacteraceae bacterium]|jgi:hypothetical protein